MTCREFVERLATHLAGEAPRGERSAVDEHLSVCADCVRYLRSYELTIRLEKASSAERGEPDDEAVADDLVRIVLAARPRT